MTYPPRHEWALGREAYLTYNATINILKGPFGVIPDWRELDPVVQEAWRAAAIVVESYGLKRNTPDDVTANGTDRGDPTPRSPVGQ
jgi:hypothetical protein